jgi:hypothetical protein
MMFCTDSWSVEPQGSIWIFVEWSRDEKILEIWAEVEDRMVGRDFTQHLDILWHESNVDAVANALWCLGKHRICPRANSNDGDRHGGDEFFDIVVDLLRGS